MFDFDFRGTRFSLQCLMFTCVVFDFRGARFSLQVFNVYMFDFDFRGAYFSLQDVFCVDCFMLVVLC